MFAKWTFGRKVGAGFAVAGLVLAVLATVGYQNTHHLIDNNRWVSHTQEVRRDLANLLSLLKDIETAMRGFVITGDESFLEPLKAAVPVVAERFKNLKKLTSDNPRQQTRLDKLGPQIDLKLVETNNYVETRRKSGLEPAVKLVASGEGKRTMDEIRRMVGEIDAEEHELLDVRTKGAEESAANTKLVLLWGAVIGLLFIAIAGAVIVRSLGEQIGNAVKQMQSSSTELQAAATQQATGAKEQVSAMSEISTTISELLATSRQIAESAQRVAQIAGDTATAARAGDTTVDRSQESIAGIRRQVDLIVSHMLELGKKSQQVGAVLDIVAELAEQTNILAINATIEAAGAGEAGRRFAVVADEIRKLADRVAGSTKQIRELIDDVRSAVNNTVMTTETGSKAVDAGTRQLADVAGAFRHISGLVGTTTEAAKEIGLSTKQQTTAVEQVNLAVTSVAQATRETEASTAQTQQTAADLAGLSRDLLRIVQPQA